VKNILSKLKLFLFFLSIISTILLISIEWEPEIIDSAKKAQDVLKRLDGEKKEVENQLRNEKDTASDDYRENYRKLVEIEIDRETAKIAQDHFTNSVDASYEKKYKERIKKIEQARANAVQKESFFKEEEERITKEISSIFNPSSGQETDGTQNIPLTATEKLKLRTRAFLAERLANIYIFIGNQSRIEAVAKRLQDIYSSLNDPANKSRTLRLEGVASSRLDYALRKHAEALTLLENALKAKRSMRVLDELSITLIDLIRLRSLLPEGDKNTYEKRAQIDQLINQLYTSLQINAEFRVYIEKQAGNPDASFIGVRTNSSNRELARLYDTYRFKKLADIKKNSKNAEYVRKSIQSLIDGTETVQRFFESPARQTISAQGKLDVYNGLKWTYIEIAELSAKKIIELSNKTNRSAKDNANLRYFIDTFYEAEQTNYLIQTKIAQLAQASALPIPESIQSTSRYKQYRELADKAIKLTPQQIQTITEVVNKSSTTVSTQIENKSIQNAKKEVGTLKEQLTSLKNLLVRVPGITQETISLETQIIQNISDIIDKTRVRLQQPNLPQTDQTSLAEILIDAAKLQKDIVSIQAFHLNQSTPVFSDEQNKKIVVIEDSTLVEHPYANSLESNVQSQEAQELQETIRTAAVLAIQDNPDAFVPPAPPPPSINQVFSIPSIQQENINAIEKTIPAQPSFSKSLAEQIESAKLKSVGQQEKVTNTDALTSTLLKALTDRRTAIDPDEEPQESDSDEWDDTEGAD